MTRQERDERAAAAVINEISIEAVVDGKKIQVQVSAYSPLGQELVPHIREEFGLRLDEDGS
jgi:hypothetical protein